MIQTLSDVDHHIRVLVCSVAFGMGIGCQYIVRVIHFGGSKCI